MVAKVFITPFALNGNKTAIPDASQPGGEVSYDQGFGPDYERQLGVDPAAKNIEREDFNQAMYDTTLALREIQSGEGVSAFNASLAAAIGGYEKGAIIPRADGNGYWVNTVANNSANPTAAGVTWFPTDVYGSFTQALSNSSVAPSNNDAAYPTIILTGTVTANLSLILPAWVGKQWNIINRCTGNFTVTVRTAGTGVIVANGTNATVACTGANLELVDTTPALQAVIGDSRNTVMQITAATATGTFTADSLVVGTALNGPTFRLTNISRTINLATTGAGGMDTGAAPASGYVALYVIYNPTTNTSAMLATNVTAIAATEVYSGANMPAGFTMSALVSVVSTNGSGQFLPHILRDREIFIDVITVLNASSTQRASPFSLSIASAIPVSAKKFGGIVNISSTLAAVLNLSVGSTSLLLAQQGASTSGNQTVPGLTASFSNVPVNPVSPQTLYYTATVSAGTMTASIFISSYKI